MKYNLIEKETGKRVFCNTTDDFDIIKKLCSFNPGTQIVCMHSDDYGKNDAWF